MFSDAVRRNPLTCRATDTIIQHAVTKWLQFACDHDGGREERQKKKDAGGVRDRSAGGKDDGRAWGKDDRRAGGRDDGRAGGRDDGYDVESDDCAAKGRDAKMGLGLRFSL